MFKNNSITFDVLLRRKQNIDFAKLKGDLEDRQRNIRPQPYAYTH